MKTASHQYEDRLLEFAYGELPAHEAEAVDAHVRSCSRCAEALSDIRTVRTTMDQLPLEEAPPGGLDSLLAYAEQQASRNRAAAPLPWWRRIAKAPLVASLSSVAALAVVGLVAWEANKAYSPSPAAVALEAKAEHDARYAPQPATVNDHGAEKAAKPNAPPAQVGQLEAPAAAVATQGDTGAQAFEPKKRKAAVPAPMKKAAKRDDFAVGVKVETKSSGSGSQAKEIAPEALPQEALSQADDSELKVAPALDSSGARGSLARQEAQKQATAPPKSAPVDLPAPAASAPAPAPSGNSLGLSGLDRKASKKPQRSVAEVQAVSKAEEREQALPSKDAQPRPKALVEAARAAGLKGDAGAEVKLALAALAAGASGADRLEMLNRLCSAYERLGDVERADPYCDRVLTEFPSSSSAGEIASRRKSVQHLAPPASSAAPLPPSERSKARPAEGNK